ncbi:outer membrane protein assembly factor BamA [Alkalilimnicola sp. S0819]|nr:outer membrane protein assembly factor BamA [Alkalilimnicola sp. S0819]MPQ15560.1 outer membrane protein assembly factor BamA [Alkalilimnicola sp. S0819]
MLLPAVAQAFQPFQVQDIRVEGLRRIAPGTVFNYLPVRAGERLDQRQAATAIRDLYATGFFQDVRLERDGDVLVIEVRERPAVARIEFRGNDSIPTEDLRDSLREVGLREGEVLDRALLTGVENELRKQYFARGQYDAQVTATVSPLPRNRVGVRIDVVEGETARVSELHFVGNQAVGSDRLRGLFTLGRKRWYHFFSSRDEYSRDKLEADLERLRSYYQDRGYANFRINSTQVSLSPDLQRIYITVNLSEGEPFGIGEVRLAGSTILPREELRELIPLAEGDRYSRGQITAGAQAISERLAEDGYAFARVNPVPEVDEENKTVTLTYFVEPGKRAYVRRINIHGNYRTQDEVIRRELRQMEAGWLSAEDIKRSRERLNRLGFFDQVQIETPQVPGTDDQVDVNVSVVERLSGSFQIGVGYGESQGVMLNASVHQDNVLGTGDRLGVTLNTSEVDTVYSVSYLERFWTRSGISRSFNGSYRETDAREADLRDYRFETLNLGVGFGIPVTEYDTLHLGVAYENLELELGDEASQHIKDWVDENGDDFDMLKASVSWSRDTRNRAIFPTRGGVQKLGAEVTVPGSDLEFYKLSYSNKRYFPLLDSLTLSVEGAIGYGNGYGDTRELPFFENFYAGGMTTVRGYKGSSLGPRDEDGDPTGGNVRVVGRAELIFPVPFTDLPSVRMAAFVDGGNVYDTEPDAFTSDGDIDLSRMRYASGLALTWISPLGALTVSLAQALNAEVGDKTETFQFSLGTAF